MTRGGRETEEAEGSRICDRGKESHGTGAGRRGSSVEHELVASPPSFLPSPLPSLFEQTSVMELLYINSYLSTRLARTTRVQSGQYWLPAQHHLWGWGAGCCTTRRNVRSFSRALFSVRFMRGIHSQGFPPLPPQ